MSGVVEGGWGFVVAAYSITTLGFVIYAASLVARLMESKKHD